MTKETTRKRERERAKDYVLTSCRHTFSSLFFPPFFFLFEILKKDEEEEGRKSREERCRSMVFKVARTRTMRHTERNRE
jgi:hypothetical protein